MGNVALASNPADLAAQLRAWADDPELSGVKMGKADLNRLARMLDPPIAIPDAAPESAWDDADDPPLIPLAPDPSPQLDAPAAKSLCMVCGVMAGPDPCGYGECPNL